MSCGYRPWDQNCRRTLLTQLTDRFFGRNSPSHGIFSCKRFRLSDHLLMETFISQEKDSEGDYGSAKRENKMVSTWAEAHSLSEDNECSGYTLMVLFLNPERLSNMCSTDRASALDRSVMLDVQDYKKELIHKRMQVPVSILSVIKTGWRTGTWGLSRFHKDRQYPDHQHKEKESVLVTRSGQVFMLEAFNRELTRFVLKEVPRHPGSVISLSWILKEIITGASLRKYEIY